MEDRMHSSQALQAGERKLKAEADAKGAKRKAAARVAASGYKKLFVGAVAVSAIHALN